MLEFDDGSTLGGFGMAQLYNEYGHSLKFSDEHGYSRLQQWNAQWKDMPGPERRELLAGTALVQPNDIHLSDFWNWNPAPPALFPQVPSAISSTLCVLPQDGQTRPLRTAPHTVGG